MALYLKARFRAAPVADDAVVGGSSGSTLAVAITSPAEGATVTGTIMVTGTLDATAEVVSVEVNIDGFGFYAASFAGAAWSYSLDTTLYPAGLASIAVVARDTEGAIATDTEMVNFSVRGTL